MTSASAPTSAFSDSGVRIVFLGGLGEVGRNCFCLEQDGRILVVDCGLMFPDDDMPGVDLVLPDFTYLRERADQVEGIYLTHAHEDHAGALAYLLGDVPAPIYGSALSLGMARRRIEEARLLGQTSFVPIATDGERRNIGPFDVTFVPVTHSVPHAFAAGFHTPAGTIIHTGDFKIDLTPVDGRRTDLATLGAMARSEGCRVLLSDSTNAEHPGSTPSERTVGTGLRHIFREHPDKRILVASFASHLHRVEQVIDAARRNNRKIVLLGRSMVHNVTLAREMGLLRLNEDVFVDPEDAHKFAPGEICVICTGSQGEPMSALSLMAARSHRYLELGPDDVVVISAHAIPGNETNVGRVINALHRAGATVVHGRQHGVHVSGHASADELRTMINLVEPEWFIPVHGEMRQMASHAHLAKECGVEEEKILICEDGDAVTVGETLTVERHSVPAGYVYVDGTVGDIGAGVLRDRRKLAEEGLVVVFVVVDVGRAEIVSGPEIVTRGWIYAEEAEDLLDEASETVARALVDALTDHIVELDALRRVTRKAVGSFIADRTKRRPQIIPVVVEV